MKIPDSIKLMGAIIAQAHHDQADRIHIFFAGNVTQYEPEETGDMGKPIHQAKRQMAVFFITAGKSKMALSGGSSSAERLCRAFHRLTEDGYAYYKAHYWSDFQLPKEIQSEWLTTTDLVLTLS